jgi:ferric-dicitrate binding protein FerR (iron transport regulator)
MSLLSNHPLACKHLDRTLSLEACTVEKRDEALVHAGDCPVCGPALDELNAAGRALRAVDPQPLVTAERARIWRGVAARRRAPAGPMWWALGGLAVAATAAVVLLALRTGDADSDALPMTVVMGELTPVDMTDPALEASPASAVAGGAAVEAGAPRPMPVSRWVRAPRTVAADLGLARVSLSAGSVVSLEPRAAREVDLRLYRGIASVSVEKLAPSEAFEVTTPLARVKVVGTRFQVESRAEATHIRVEEGTVWVWENGSDKPTSDKPTVVHAGQELDVRAPATPREVLSEARALLDSDATGAARIAGSLVDQGAAPEVEVEAILVLADAERRRGEAAKAAELYRRVAEHARGGAYAEEALYKCASLLGAAGDASAALTALADAETRVGAGAIGPERASLEAELLLGAGQRTRAAAAFARAAERARAMGDDASARVFSERGARLR